VRKNNSAYKKRRQIKKKARKKSKEELIPITISSLLYLIHILSILDTQPDFLGLASRLDQAGRLWNGPLQAPQQIEAILVLLAFRENNQTPALGIIANLPASGKGPLLHVISWQNQLVLTDGQPLAPVRIELDRRRHPPLQGKAGGGLVQSRFSYCPLADLNRDFVDMIMPFVIVGRPQCLAVFCSVNGFRARFHAWAWAAANRQDADQDREVETEQFL
jgi:hypothetical protein